MHRRHAGLFLHHADQSHLVESGILFQLFHRHFPLKILFKEFENPRKESRLLHFPVFLKRQPHQKFIALSGYRNKLRRIFRIRQIPDCLHRRQKLREIFHLVKRRPVQMQRRQNGREVASLDFQYIGMNQPLRLPVVRLKLRNHQQFPRNHRILLSANPVCDTAVFNRNEHQETSAR